MLFIALMAHILKILRRKQKLNRNVKIFALMIVKLLLKIEHALKDVEMIQSINISSIGDASKNVL